jgi:hypothetical protein
MNEINLHQTGVEQDLKPPNVSRPSFQLPGVLIVICSLLLIVGAPVLIRLFFDTLTEVGPRALISFWDNNGGLLLLYFTAGLPLGAILLAAGGARLFPAAKSAGPVLLPLLAFELIYFTYHATRFNFDLGIPRLLFAAIGCLFNVLLIGLVWFWARSRPSLAPERQRVTDLQLGAGLCFFSAAWQACGLASAPGFAIRPELVQKLANQSFIFGQVLAVQVFMALGFIFLLLAMRTERVSRKTGSE